MHNREFLSSVIEQYINQIAYPTSPARLYKPIAYTMADGGKRIRPLLVLMACEAFSDSYEPAIDAAVAVEMFHNFTLLHDDIMDNSAVRRGKPSVHNKWGVNAAILSGDAMVVSAYGLLGRSNPQKLAVVLEVFNKMALEVCEGQQYDIDFESQPVVPMANYMEMIRLKTSVLLAGASQIGAILGGANDSQAETIYRFAVELGLAFQIQDDILDTYGTTEQLGKPIGGDILEGKKTFLMITAFERADAKVRASMRVLLENDTISDKEKINSMRFIYDSLDVHQIARRAVEHHTTVSLAALGELTAELGAERLEPLGELVATLVNRDK